MPIFALRPNPVCVACQCMQLSARCSAFAQCISVRALQNLVQTANMPTPKKLTPAFFVVCIGVPGQWYMHCCGFGSKACSEYSLRGGGGAVGGGPPRQETLSYQRRRTNFLASTDLRQRRKKIFFDWPKGRRKNRPISLKAGGGGGGSDRPGDAVLFSKTLGMPECLLRV